jgi:hypothetical protein
VGVGDNGKLSGVDAVSATLAPELHLYSQFKAEKPPGALHFYEDKDAIPDYSCAPLA